MRSAPVQSLLAPSVSSANTVTHSLVIVASLTWADYLSEELRDGRANMLPPLLHPHRRVTPSQVIALN